MNVCAYGLRGDPYLRHYTVRTNLESRYDDVEVVVFVIVRRSIEHHPAHREVHHSFYLRFL
jgi:hypothetical protein